MLDSLPKPGQWAKYESTAIVPGTPEQQHEWSRVVRCLPDSSNREPACVWIELEIDNTTGGSTIFKLLVSESELRPGGEPLNHLVEGWKLIKPGIGKAVPVQPFRGTLQPIPISDNELKMLIPVQFASPTEESEQLMRDYFDVNGETVRCQGIAFMTRLTDDDSENIYQFENYVSPDVPFGMVSTNVSHTVKQNRKKFLASTVTTVLVASGDDAVSSIPDVK